MDQATAEGIRELTSNEKKLVVSFLQRLVTGKWERKIAEDIFPKPKTLVLDQKYNGKDRFVVLKQAQDDPRDEKKEKEYKMLDTPYELVAILYDVMNDYILFARCSRHVFNGKDRLTKKVTDFQSFGFAESMAYALKYAYEHLSYIAPEKSTLAASSKAIIDYNNEIVSNWIKGDMNTMFLIPPNINSHAMLQTITINPTWFSDEFYQTYLIPKTVLEPASSSSSSSSSANGKTATPKSKPTASAKPSSKAAASSSSSKGKADDKKSPASSAKPATKKAATSSSSSSSSASSSSSKTKTASKTTPSKKDESSKKDDIDFFSNLDSVPKMIQITGFPSEANSSTFVSETMYDQLMAKFDELYPVLKPHFEEAVTAEDKAEFAADKASVSKFDPVSTNLWNSVSRAGLMSIEQWLFYFIQKAHTTPSVKSCFDQLERALASKNASEINALLKGKFTISQFLGMKNRNKVPIFMGYLVLCSRLSGFYEEVITQMKTHAVKFNRQVQEDLAAWKDDKIELENLRQRTEEDKLYMDSQDALIEKKEEEITKLKQQIKKLTDNLQKAESAKSKPSKPVVSKKVVSVKKKQVDDDNKDSSDHASNGDTEDDFNPFAEVSYHSHNNDTQEESQTTSDDGSASAEDKPIQPSYSYQLMESPSETPKTKITLDETSEGKAIDLSGDQESPEQPGSQSPAPTSFFDF